MIFRSKEKRISLTKEEGLERVIERLIKAKSKRIILNVPPDSRLCSNIENFEILKKEVEDRKLELIVESVDERFLGMASLVGLKTIHPVFGIQGKIMTDILPQKLPLRKKREEVKLKERKEEPSVKKSVAEKIQLKEIREIKRKKPRVPFHFPWKKLLIALVILALGGGGFELAVNFLPRADITLKFKKTIVDFEKNISVGKQIFKIGENSAGDLEIPGELLVFRQNIQLSQSATGKEEVALKANGSLIIFNAFSSQPQVLVARTRFQSPDGKIFRLTKRIIVPGAEVVGGQIKPSQIEAEVVADEPGADYNLPPTFWKIVGFQGTPKYEKIYAQSTEPMKGGALGEKPVPTVEDINQLKAKVEATLQTALQNQTLRAIAQRFKILKEASDFQILKMEINPQVDEKGNFSIFGEAQRRYLVFEEAALRQALIQKIKDENLKELDLKVSELNFDYRDIKIDFDQGKMDLKIKGRAVFVPLFDPLIFKNQIANMEEKAVRNSLASLPQLEDAKISFWPFWVEKVPANLRHININIGYDE